MKYHQWILLLCWKSSLEIVLNTLFKNRKSQLSQREGLVRKISEDLINGLL